MEVPKVRYTSADTRIDMQLRPNLYFSASLRHFFARRQWLLIVTMHFEVMSISFQNAFDLKSVQCRSVCSYSVFECKAKIANRNS
jgi:hypothetical protein